MDQMLLILMDESLSMRSKKLDVVNGINQFINVQREINPESRLILIKFNNNVNIVHKGIDINLVEPLKMSDYNPSGRTALFDAVTCALKLTDELRTNFERVNCIMLTDGEDNASQQNKSLKFIKKLMKKYEMKTDWSFTFLGKPTEYWYRKKPVSDISYETKPQSNFNQNNTSAVAWRRLRYNNNGNGQQQQQLQAVNS